MCVQVTDTTQAPREASGRLFRLPRSPVPLVSAVRRPPTASPQAGAVRGLRKARRLHWRLLFGTSSFPGSARGTGESRAMLLLHGRENRVSVKRAALLDGRAGHFLQKPTAGPTLRTEGHRQPLHQAETHRSPASYRRSPGQPRRPLSPAAWTPRGPGLGSRS